MKTPQPRRRVGTAAPRTRNDQYFDLWERILEGLTKAMQQRRPGKTVDRLDRLATRLERAQERGTLPPALVKDIPPRSRGGPVR